MFSCAQILYERGGVSDKTSHILHKNLLSALKEVLRPGAEFWDSARTLKTLAERQYFVTDDGGGGDDDGRSGYPQVLRNMLADGKDCLLLVFVAARSLNAWISVVLHDIS